MKKYGLALLLLLSSVYSFGQINRPNPLPNFQQFGSPTTLTQVNGILYSRVGFAPALYTDTTSANTTVIDAVPLSVIATSSDGKLWRRSMDVSKWEEITIGGGSGFGTVTSVGLSNITSFATATGSPVTGSGTLGYTLNTQSANTVFAGPSTGAAAIPTFRALVSSDIPALPSRYWELTGNSGNNITTNFLGTTDSVPFSIKVNNRYAAYLSRAGIGASNIVVNFTGAYTTYGQMSGYTLTPMVVAGTSNGRGNQLFGTGAGMYIGASYDTASTEAQLSSENTVVGLGGLHFTQRRSFVTATGRNVMVGQSTCFNCLTPGETTGVGTYTFEAGHRPTKSSAFGSNALRTGNSASFMTAIGAYASAFSGGVVTSITVNNGGSGYTLGGTTVTISAPYNHGSPGACYATATATPIIDGGTGAITGFTITNPGCGYPDITGTYYTGFTNYFPVVTVTGDGTGFSGTVVVTQAWGTTSLGHAAGWLSRAPQYMLYLAEGSEPNTRYFDAYGGAIGKGSGVHSSISPLQKITNGWAVGTNAKVSTDRTFVIGAPIGDSTLKFVLNGHTGDSIMTINGGGLNIASAGGGLKVTGLASPYSGHYTMPIVTSTGSVINGWVTQDVGGSAILRNDDVARGTTTTNGFLGIFRNSYAGDATSNATPMFYVNTASNSSTQKYMYAAVAPNMPTGSTISNYLGYRTSTRNNFLHTFFLAGSGSVSNFMEEQFQGVANVSRRYASGNSTFGNTLTADLGYRLQIDHITKADTLSGNRFAIGADYPVASAIGEFTSTTRGLLVPRMNTTEQDAISSPATSLLIFNTDTAKFRFFNGSVWETIGGGAGGGSGTVTSFAATDGNGFDFSVANATTTPTLTATTTVADTRLFFSNSGAISSSANLTFVSPALTIGVAGSATGQLKLTGATSGTATIQAPATAGTPTLTLPTVTGTISQFAEGTTASSATPSPSGDARENVYDVTALATDPTFAAPSGTPANHNTLLIRIKDDGTSRTLAWNAIYRGGTVLALPTATTISKTMYVYFVYNSADSKWDIVGYTDGI